MSRETMKQALEALELLAKYENPSTKIQVRKPKDGGPIVTMYPHKVATEAAALLRERLAQPEQKPVAWVNSLDFDDDDQEIIPAKDKGKLGTSNCDIPLYTTPKHDYVIDCPRCGHCCAERTWVGLTDDEMEALFLNEDGVRFARYIESRLKDKNA